MPRNYYDDFTPKDYARYNMPKRKKKDENFFHSVKKAIIIGCACILAGVVSLELYLASLPPIQNLDKFKPNIVTKFYANDETNVIKTFTAYTFQKIELKDVPDNLTKAIIATEDKNFYHHHGYDLTGLVRSSIQNVIAGHVVQGASTITQQLARVLFLSNERTFDRKLKELFIAARIEKTISKDKILEMYMNNVYLGSGAYGVEGAAQIYFDKHLKDCDLAELALIAGLPQAPSVYNPFNNMDLAVQRRNQVLTRMYKMRYITTEEYEKAKEEKVHLAKVPQYYTTNKAPYFCDYVMKELEKLGFDEAEISQGGYKVVTTLDYKAQQRANEALINVPNSWGLRGVKRQAAIFSFSPIDGKILVYAGGRDYSKSQYDRVTQAIRPPGSSFKPFVYATAVEKGLEPNDTIDDSPFKAGDWKPQNYGHKYRGKIPVYKALMVSSNVCAARVIQSTGIRPVIQLVRLLGLTTPLEYDYTIALGSNGVKLFELTRAYGAFANGGYMVEPYAVEKIETSRGKVIYQAPRARATKVIEEHTAAVMTAMLKTVIKSGTGKAADIGKPAAGKTGTTDDYKDAWFVGYTPEVVTGVWVGNDDNSKNGRVTGGTVPALIWKEVMRAATEPYGATEFNYENIPLNNYSGGKRAKSLGDNTNKTTTDDEDIIDGGDDMTEDIPDENIPAQTSSRPTKKYPSASVPEKRQSSAPMAPVPMATPAGLDRNY